VSTSAFGVGADFDERLLRDMAHEGGGNFYFIEGASQIPAMLTSELGETLEVTLRDASLTVRLPRGATAETLNRFRQARLDDRSELRVDVGDLVSAQELDIVLKVTFPQGELGQRTSIDVELASSGDLIRGSKSGLEWSYATHGDNDVQPRNREVDRAVAELYAARARAEATEANRNGRYEQARHVLEATAARIREYAGDDQTLQRLASVLRDDVPQYAEAPMAAMMLKRSLYASEAASKGRDALGRARRRP
jgi:hypothetical protein